MADSLMNNLYSLNSYFLGIVQPQQLTQDGAPIVQLEDGVPDAILDSFSEDTEQWVKYLLGYAILLGIGALFVVAMPIAGLLFCCCRNCCKCCCVQTNLREGKHTKCARVCCGTFLFIFTFIVVIGCGVCAYASLELWRETNSDGGALEKINNHIYALESYADDTIDEAEDALIDGYETAYNTIIEELNGLGLNTLDEIGQLTNVEPLLEQLYNFTDAIPEMEESLNNATALGESLDAQAQALSIDLDLLTAAVIDDAALCVSIADECGVSKLMAEALHVQVDYSLLPSLDFAILSLQVAIDNDLEGMIDSANDSYHGIAASINDTWYPEVVRLTEELSVLNDTIVNATNELEVAIPEVDLSSLTNEIDSYHDEVETYGTYWFYASAGFSGILLLICVCYLLGLCMGACCKLPSAHSKHACSTRHASRCLLCGVALTFMFTWLHMLATMALFVSGGLSYTEVCRYISPLTHTSPGLVAIETVAEDFPFDNASITTLVESCEDNLSIYQALGLNDTNFNTSEYLSLEAIDEILQQFKTAEYDLNTTLVTSQLNNTLKIVSTGLDSINFTHFYVILGTNITSVHLNEFAAQLQRTADDLYDAGLGSLGDKFRDYAMTSEELHNTSVIPMQYDVDEMTADLEFVEETRDDADLNNLLVELSIAQDELNSQGGHLVEASVNNTVDTIYVTLVNVTDAMAYAIKYKIGRCRSVYDALAGVVDVVCKDVLDPYNLTWFAQGWNLIVLLPSLGIALRMSRFYRKTIRHNAVEDVPGNNEDSNNNNSALSHSDVNIEHSHANGAVVMTQSSVRATETFELQEVNTDHQNVETNA